jgi:hypothetical protein
MKPILGEFLFVAIATLVVVVVLLIFPYFEERIEHIRESRTYTVVVAIEKAEKMAQLQQAFEKKYHARPRPS